MRHEIRWLAFWVWAVCATALLGCSPNSGAEDGGMDSGPDADADADADTDADGDGDTDTDTDADADSDADADADTDTDADSDADTDTGTGPPTLPEGCEFLSPANENGFGWTGRGAVHGGHVVWRWIDYGVSPSEHVLMVHDFSTGQDTEVMRTISPIYTNTPTVYNDRVVYMGDDGIFTTTLSEATPSQLPAADGSYPLAGHDIAVYFFYNDTDAGIEYGYKYHSVSGNEEHVISTISGGTSEYAFDGVRWMTYLDDNFLFKFDLQNPQDGPQQVTDYESGTTGMAFDRSTGTMVSGTNVNGESQFFRLQLWNIETDEMTVLLDEPWDQIAPDVDGNVVVYLDSQEAGENWWTNQLGEIRIVDRQTLEKRTVMPTDRYYGVGIWEHWIAFNNVGTFGDSIIVCDLLEGGFMDAEGHVCPEGGCPEPETDGGVDGGSEPDASVDAGK